MGNPAAHAASRRTCAAQQRMPATAGHALRSRQEREQAQPSLLLKQCPAAVPMAGHCWVPAAGGKPVPLRVLGEHRQYPQEPGAGHRQPRAQKSLHAPRVSNCSRGAWRLCLRPSGRMLLAAWPKGLHFVWCGYAHQTERCRDDGANGTD